MTATDWNAHMRGAIDARAGMAPRETTEAYRDGYEAATLQTKGCNR